MRSEKFGKMIAATLLMAGICLPAMADENYGDFKHTSEAKQLKGEIKMERKTQKRPHHALEARSDDNLAGKTIRLNIGMGGAHVE